ncbi:GNAT family N-acetyltransferase [Arthrobacter sp. TMS2-4]
MTNIEIRPTADQDIQALAQVHVQAWRWAYRGLLPDVILDGLDVDRRAASWNQMVHEEMLPRPWVAVAGSDIVGFAHADTSRDDDASTRTGEVTALYLNQDHVGTGVGRRLWNAALNQLRNSGHTELTVWVLETNGRGRRFYERTGMTNDGTTKEQEMRESVLTELRYRSSLAAL